MGRFIKPVQVEGRTVGGTNQPVNSNYTTFNLTWQRKGQTKSDRKCQPVKNRESTSFKFANCRNLKFTHYRADQDETFIIHTGGCSRGGGGGVFKNFPLRNSICARVCVINSRVHYYVCEFSSYGGENERLKPHVMRVGTFIWCSGGWEIVYFSAFE